MVRALGLFGLGGFRGCPRCLKLQNKDYTDYTPACSTLRLESLNPKP